MSELIRFTHLTHAFVLILFLFAQNVNAQTHSSDSSKYQIAVSSILSTYNPSEDAKLKEVILPYVDSTTIEGDYVLVISILSELINDHYYQNTIDEKRKWDNRAQQVLSDHSEAFFGNDIDSLVYKNYQHSRGNLLYEMGAYIESIRVFKKLILQKENQRLSLEDSIYINTWYSYLGSAYLLLDKPDRAIANYQQYLKYIPQGLDLYYGSDGTLFYKILGWTYLANCWTAKSYDSKESAFYKRALEGYHQSLDLIKRLDRPEDYGNTILSVYSGLVSLQQQFTYYDSASFYLSQSEKYVNFDKSQVSDILLLKAKSERVKNEHQKAQSLLNQAVEENIRLYGKSHYSLYEIYIEKAKVYEAMGSFKEALSYCDLAIDLLSNQNNKAVEYVHTLEAIEVLKEKAGILAHQGAELGELSIIEASLENYKRAIDLSITDRERHLRNEAKQQRINRHRKLISEALEVCINANKMSNNNSFDHFAYEFIEKGKSLL
ncbi:hypothetical protein E1176_02095, partial [Fulvivirga sp. RKSG066]|uniref:tetratricopeptide repeat protein n=1 Tax=Fulvivirga aurantia TaxID=2529383 RepID=UPI0012BC9BAD